MFKIFPLFLVFILTAQVKHLKAQNLDKNTQFLSDVKSKNWNHAITYFTPDLRNKINGAQLNKLFDGIALQIGQLESFDSTAVKKKGKSFFYIGRFTNTTLAININTDDSAKIVGFFFRPISELYEPPSYADHNKYLVSESILISGKYKLPLVVTLPTRQQGSKFPVVIFLGGSGPSDYDETVGAQKPFKDISIGLALNGIASIRFHKRTFVYKDFPNGITINEEYLLDIKSAVEYVKKMATVDTNNIYIIAHSLGGMLTPLILGKNPEVKGAVLLEANARPLQELIYEQAAYLNKTDTLKVSTKQLKALAWEINKITTITEADSTNTYFHAKGKYWLSLKKYDPIQTAQRLKNQSLLIIQGGNDYQVTGKDYKIWTRGLKNNKKAAFYFDPNINHSLVESRGTMSPDEYLEPSNVSISLILKMVTWIKSTR
jgi:esterase/lipase